MHNDDTCLNARAHMHGYMHTDSLHRGLTNRRSGPENRTTGIDPIGYRSEILSRIDPEFYFPLGNNDR